MTHVVPVRSSFGAFQSAMLLLVVLLRYLMPAKALAFHYLRLVSRRHALDLTTDLPLARGFDRLVTYKLIDLDEVEFILV